MYTFCDRAFNLLSSFCMSLEITIKKRDMQLNFIYPRSCRLRIQQPLSLSAVPSAKKKFGERRLASSGEEQVKRLPTSRDKSALMSYSVAEGHNRRALSFSQRNFL